MADSVAGDSVAGDSDREDGAELEPRISAALARLDECVHLSPSAQIEVFADIHRRLAEVLADPSARA